MKRDDWNKLEERILVANYADKTARQISEMLGRSLESVRSKARYMELTKAGPKKRRAFRRLPDGTSRPLVNIDEAMAGVDYSKHEIRLRPAVVSVRAG